jgi:hypothetical protein
MSVEDERCSFMLTFMKSKFLHVCIMILYYLELPLRGVY